MRKISGIVFIFLFLAIIPFGKAQNNMTDQKVQSLIARMTVDEKIGQLVQKNSGSFSDSCVQAGGLGSVLNEIDVETQNRIQKIAMKESRLGIPVLFARDVIHGFRTIFPIPLAQAATWDPSLVEDGARVAATEAASSGIRWTFSPMVDVCRDPRWGRVSEGFGEDPLLASEMGAAMVRGYQGNDLRNKTAVAACVKHFAAYGWAEGGRDYNSANIPENDLYDVIFPPFQRCATEGALSFMPSFNDINGIPATGNEFLLKHVLRNEWNYQGILLSDWVSITQLVTHGYAEDGKDAALKAFNATVDMDMASPFYETYLKELLNEGKISIKEIDQAVARVLKVKFELGLFDNPYTNPSDFPKLLNEKNLETAKKTAVESAVLLKNENHTLPLNQKIKSIAIIGPLADAPHDQMGTWVMDGKKQNSITPLTSIQEKAKELGIKVSYERALTLSRSKEINNKDAVINAARNADVVLLFLGEESILSGESHCRADIDLPGAQEELAKLVAAQNKTVVAIIMAGRPLTFEKIIGECSSILFAWHQGTMAGPALADLLFGVESPSGKLPMTFPQHVGQIPIYYSHRNTGKPATNQSWEKMDDIQAEAPQLSIGNTSHYLDYGFEPMYPFGYGLSYTNFEYQNLKIENDLVSASDTLNVSVELRNTGSVDASEVAQLYIRDLVASRVQPMKVLKGFQKVFLKKGETKTLFFRIPVREFGFHNPEMKFVVEPGKFNLWIGGDSNATLMTTFDVK
ncbi:MAG TPA: beta-glucosidase BglX [Prolixibacteraceae bacterium]|nr:beta-glucosidase BglX [Prolixibacteraceae bacterium]HPS11791.1 beta-glucosidase BglX [Prolixibacteraceae bacterium]